MSPKFEENVKRKTNSKVNLKVSRKKSRPTTEHITYEKISSLKTSKTSAEKELALHTIQDNKPKSKRIIKNIKTEPTSKIKNTKTTNVEKSSKNEEKTSIKTLKLNINNKNESKDTNINNIEIPVEREFSPDTSINQNSSFFSSPSVFQKCGISITDISSEKTETNNIDQTEIIETENIEQAEIVETENIDQTEIIETENNDENINDMFEDLELQFEDNKQSKITETTNNIVEEPEKIQPKTINSAINKIKKSVVSGTSYLSSIFKTYTFDEANLINIKSSKISTDSIIEQTNNILNNEITVSNESNPIMEIPTVDKTISADIFSDNTNNDNITIDMNSITDFNDTIAQTNFMENSTLPDISIDAKNVQVEESTNTVSDDNMFNIDSTVHTSLSDDEYINISSSQEFDDEENNDDFSIEDYFGLNDLNTIEEEKSKGKSKKKKESKKKPLIEEIKELDELNEDINEDLENNQKNTSNNVNLSDNDLSSLSKLLDTFTETISSLSNRISELENNSINNDQTIKNQNDNKENTSIEPEPLVEDKNNIYNENIENNELIDNTENNGDIESIESIDNTEDDENIETAQNIIDNFIEINNIPEETTTTDTDTYTINDELADIDKILEPNDDTDPYINVDDSTQDIDINDINLDDLGITIDDIETIDDTITEESTTTFEDNTTFETEENTSPDNIEIEDILTQKISEDISDIDELMKEELLNEVLLSSEEEDLQETVSPKETSKNDEDTTDDFFTIIDTLTKTISQLENSENKNSIGNSNNGKSINILIDKDDIFSISILNETYEIVADFDGISVLSENIHISTPKKNFYVTIGERYIEIHNLGTSFDVNTNFEDIEFANALNNVAFTKKNNKIELNIKEAFKLSSVNNKVELSMLNSNVAEIKKSNVETSETYNEASICDNRTLVISEETQKVYLPYTIKELMQKLDNSDEYQTLEEVIENEYTVPLSTFKMPIISRFKEAYRFMRTKEHSSVYAALDLAIELMFNSNLNPAVIRASKDLKELNVYLDCLYENELEKFDCFKIVYKVLPKIQ